MAIVQFKAAVASGGGTITLDAAPMAGNVLVYGMSRRGGAPDAPVTGPAWTQHPHGSITPGSDGARMAYRSVGFSESAAIQVVNSFGGWGIVWELSGVTFDASSFAEVTTGTQPASVNAGTLTPTAGAPALLLEFLTVHCSDWGGNGNTTITDDAAWTRDAADEVTFNGDLHPLAWGGHQTVATTAGSYATSQVIVGGGSNFGGWGGLAMAFLGSAAPPDPGVGVGVGDPDGVFITDIPDAFNKKFRVELNGTGQGSFSINRHSANATALNLARDNVVKFTVPQISPNAIFAMFLETGDFDLVSTDEEGGEILSFGGRGLLAYLERDVAWTTSYVLETEPTDGYWRYAPASHPSWSTGNEPGQILKRIIDEMQHASRPQHCMSLLVEDFDYENDTDANPWTFTDATNPVWTVAVGEDVLTTTGRLIATGAIEVQMDPDFGFHAYNHFGSDLTGGAFGPGVVRFVKGVNIADRVQRQWQGADIAPYELVAGDTGVYVRSELPDFATRVQKVVFNQFQGSSTPMLEALGLADLETRLANSESAAFAIACRRIGGPETASTGRYLPGPVGTNGDFWVGDTVRLVTGATDIDYAEQDVRVAAITISEDDGGNLVVIPELGTPPGFDNGGGGVTYGGGGITTAPGVTGGATVKDHGALIGLGDDDHSAYPTQWKDPVRVATTANGTLATAFENGDTVDGVALATGNRILLKDQSTGSQNGIYTVNASGAPTRASDFDISSEVMGAIVSVMEGGTNGGTLWRNTNTTAPTLGSTALTFAAVDTSAAHIADTTDAHDASAISIVDAGTFFTGTDVEAALQELGAATGGTTITTKDEGSTLSSTVTTLDFTGAGVTASGSGATTTVNIPGSGSSDPVTDFFGAPDTTFEFGTSSLAGLTTLGGTPDVEDADTTIPGHLYYRDNATTTAYLGRFLASPSMPFTAITKITDAPVSLNYNECGLIVGVANPATGAFMINCLSAGARTVSALKYTNRTTFGSTFINSGDHIDTPLWLGIVANSTTSLDYYWSKNGYLWVKFLAASNPSLTVGSVGVAMKSENATSFSVAFDYLRIWNSAKTFPGN